MSASGKGGHQTDVRQRPLTTLKRKSRRGYVKARSGVLLGWFAFEVGGIGKGIGAAIHPHHPGRFRSLRAPGVWHKGWNDDSVVRTNDTAFIAELHPDPAFKHHDGFFHVVHMKRHRGTRVGPIAPRSLCARN